MLNSSWSLTFNFKNSSKVINHCATLVGQIYINIFLPMLNSGWSLTLNFRNSGRVIYQCATAARQIFIDFLREIEQAQTLKIFPEAKNQNKTDS